MKTFRTMLALVPALFVAVAASNLSAASTPPKVGDKAPLVKGQDQDGNKWKLSDAIGRNIVLLYFYPKDDTPGCTKEACSLRDRMGDLKGEGVEVVGVSFDSTTSHKNFAFKYDLSFPLIADTNGKIADAYGVRLGPNKKIDRRVSFLIDLDGKIVHVTDSPNPAVHLEEMQRAIKALKGKGTY